MRSSIEFAVGKGCLNRELDVKIVQSLLNRSASALGIEPLVEDRKYGAKTASAIVAFQKRILGWSDAGADGVIKPGGPTWRRLNGNLDRPSEIRNVTVEANAKPTVSPPSAPPGSSVASYQQFKQGNTAWGQTKLGGSDLTVAKKGCALCTLVMAATLIGSRTKHWPEDVTPQSLTPQSGNEILTSAGAFSSKGWITMSTGAAALGMSYEEHGRTSKLDSSSIGTIDGHLQSNLPIAANVDYKGSSAGDHWVLITSRNGDQTYNVIDPATGKTMLFKQPGAEVTNTRHTEQKHGEAGVLIGYAGSGTGSQVDYVVVRFGLLGRA